MKIGVFYGPESPHVDYLASGASALGWNIEAQRISEDYRDRDYDAVVVGGHLHRHRRLNGRILYHYQAKGVPVFVVEMGRMLRPELPELEYWFFYLNRSPSRPLLCTSREAKERAAAIFPPVAFNSDRGEDVLIIGQDILPDARQRLIVMPEIRKATKRKLIWRPRQEHRTTTPGGCTEVSEGRSLEDDLSRAWCAVTFNSNAGGEALRAGVPVICHPSASYSNYASTDPSCIEDLERPIESDIEDYFSSMAMITWSNDEMKSGEALEWFARSGQIEEKRAPAVHVRTPRHHITALTCTGGRQGTFAKTVEYIRRQTMPPNLWVVVDDCEPITEVPNIGVETKVIRPSPKWGPGDETYARNFRAACDYITNDVPWAEWIAIFEDDDWYSKDYLDFLVPILASKYDDGIRMGGEFSNVYYHTTCRRWHRVGIGGKSATMASTVFHRDLIPEILESINGYEGLSLDLKIFHKIDPDKWVLFDTDNVIGLKGIPSQRAGGSRTHTQNLRGWDEDENLVQLRKFVGQDADFYAQFFDQEKATAVPAATPRQRRRRMLQGKALEIANARRRRR